MIKSAENNLVYFLFLCYKAFRILNEAKRRIGRLFQRICKRHLSTKRNNWSHRQRNQQPRLQALQPHRRGNKDSRWLKNTPFCKGGCQPKADWGILKKLNKKSLCHFVTSLFKKEGGLLRICSQWRLFAYKFTQPYWCGNKNHRRLSKTAIKRVDKNICLLKLS